MNTSHFILGASIAILLQPMTSFAGAMKVNARDFNCSELQTLLSEQGELKVRANLIGRYHVVALPQQCSPAQIAKAAEFRTLDSSRCELGFTCEFQNIGEGGF